MQQNQSPRLPAPTGQHAVGRTTYTCFDASRANRPVRVATAYPALVTAAKTGPYYPDLAELRKNPEIGPTIANYFGALLQPLINNSVRSNVYDNAPVAQEGKPFPVLLFSHGLGQSPFTYGIQLEDLASHGYVVVAISHVGDALAISIPGGASAPFVPWGAAASTYDVHQRLFVEDLVFTLDQITVLSRDARSRFNGVLDLDRVGAFGHSIGGR